jgi:glycosyltransferase involved in cell wall biosynthesis
VKIIATLSAYNEAKNIRPVIAKILDQGYGCIVVDDGSRDATAQIAEEAGAIVVRHPVNLGQGYAVLTGLKAAIRHPGCEIVLEMDADGQHRPEEIRLFVERLEEGNADIVVGSRTLGRHGRDAPFLRRTMLPYVTWGINKLSGYRITDAMCGFRAFRASSLMKVLPLLDNMLEPQYLSAEMFIRFGRAGLVIDEVPVQVEQRSSGVSTKGMLRYGTGILKAALRTMIEAKPRP